MNVAETSVFIVDDDELVRDLLEQLIKSVGLKVETFSSAKVFLETFNPPDNPCCLISDIRMPGLSGLDLQEELSKIGCSIPIIFITGYGTVPMSVRAMKAGAVDFLQKPFENQELIEIVHRAIEKNRKEKLQQDEIKDIEQRLKSLTKRELEVVDLVVNGILNKDIANSLYMSENTVKTHRRHIMQKMEIGSSTELVRLIEKYRIHSQLN